MDIGCWNTWDWRRFTRLVFLRGGRSDLVVTAAVVDDLSGELREDFRWRDLHALGPHSPRGRSGSVSVAGGEESPFLLEWAARGERLCVRLVPGRSTWRRAVFLVHRPGDGRYRADGTALRIGEFVLRAAGDDPTTQVLSSGAEVHWVGRPGETLRLAAAPGSSADSDVDRIDNIIDTALADDARSGVRGGGVLAGLPETMCRACHWNTVWHPRLGKPVVVATRDWCRSWNGVLVFGWDTLLNAVLASAEDPDLAYATLECALEPVDRLGFVPNWAFSSGAVTADRSHPPVGGLAALRVWRAWPDRARMIPLLEKMLAWHDWWPGARDRGDGLLSWGSNAQPVWSVPQIRQRSQHAAICACWESGLDNSPLFDGVAFDSGQATLVDADVGLNALWAADAERLSVLARELGRQQVSERLAREHHETAVRIEERLYDRARGVHANLAGSGRFTPSLTPTSLWPLLTGEIDGKRAERAVRVLFDDQRKLGGDWGLPSVTRDDPAFEENDYWRGRVWGPLNFLTHEAFRRAGMMKAAHRLAQISRRHFEKGWREENGVFENYSAVSGCGGDVANSDRLYTWGGLLAYTAVVDLIDADLEGALCVGHPESVEAEIYGWPLFGSRWDVVQGPAGMTVWRDGREVLTTEKPARLRIHEGEVCVLEGEPGRVEWKGWQGPLARR